MYLVDWKEAFQDKKVFKQVYDLMGFKDEDMLAIRHSDDDD